MCALYKVQDMAYSWGYGWGWRLGWGLWIKGDEWSGCESLICMGSGKYGWKGE